jgi:hypothetical protein
MGLLVTAWCSSFEHFKGSRLKGTRQRCVDLLETAAVVTQVIWWMNYCDFLSCAGAQDACVHGSANGGTVATNGELQSSGSLENGHANVGTEAGTSIAEGSLVAEQEEAEQDKDGSITKKKKKKSKGMLQAHC